MEEFDKGKPVLFSEPELRPELLDLIINEGRLARCDEQKVYAKEMLVELAQQVVAGEMAAGGDLERMIHARIAEIDRLIGEQVNEIIHHDEVQRLEASWRGVSYLVHQAETGSDLKIRVLSASKQELARDMEKAAEFDQSSLFKKVYEEEFGSFGGDSYGCLVGDYEFGNTPQDLALLTRMSEVAAAAHAPLITSASSSVFGVDSYAGLDGPRDLAKIFQGADYARWRSFRMSEDAKYVALCLPHVLMRLPYGPDTDPVESFQFEEDVAGGDHGKYLWGNAAYCLAGRITDAFSRYGWTAAIRGVEGGGAVTGLPFHTFDTGEGELAAKCPTEIAITDRREKELADLGFVPLVHCKGTDMAAFFSIQSAHKPKLYDSDVANANARLSAQLQYILSVSRFAHYLKAMMRDKIGSFGTRKNIEDYLNRWISRYVLLDDDAGQEMKARFPLREARIEVFDQPGRPGCYRAVAFLKPHYQLDELTISLRLVANLPSPRKG
ncbi:type VI secretion system contractile sheath large subunit [Geomonas subterranea]|uniref:Type VI secretion system contractile sheath large subunit n=1 Tax=Geomonas subterranea TaxID=2847989 RepID=A0ABX8LNE5_9BACT|nr:type VI secretion system contractile sheath large subunit [Geomonas subterranea]QXE92846.1 type VI secretion system contractile sheath large subunit [Geomonas subterranea]QXM09049.1 type VI secretion system contractile sheath large subunit [Geomonas subterranea]